MRLHLPLGFGDESQADAVSRDAGGHAQEKAPGVPDRVQPAGASIEFLESFGAPGQVVLFFLGGLEQVAFDFLGTRHQRLAPVERLGGNLAGVVDAHEGDAVAAGGGGEVGFGDVGGGGWAGLRAGAWSGCAGPGRRRRSGSRGFGG